MKLTVLLKWVTIFGTFFAPTDIQPSHRSRISPDYKKLSVLRQFFPHVPILALSATCPPRVLQDILKILKMKPVIDGKGVHVFFGCANN